MSSDSRIDFLRFALAITIFFFLIRKYGYTGRGRTAYAKGMQRG
jgi:hypothetical protein